MDFIYRYVPVLGLVSFPSGIALPPAPSIVGVVVVLQRASDSHQIAEERVLKTNGFGMFAACVFRCCVCI